MTVHDLNFLNEAHVNPINPTGSTGIPGNDSPAMLGEAAVAIDCRIKAGKETSIASYNWIIKPSGDIE